MRSTRLSDRRSNWTDAQVREAREFERAGLTTYSQALKAFERRNEKQIEEWKKQLAEKEKQQN